MCYQVALVALILSGFLPQKETLSPKVVGVWIVDTEHREFKGGRRTTLNGDKFVIVLPNRIVVVRPFQHRGSQYDFSILGSSNMKDGKILLLCKGKEGHRVRMKLSEDNGVPSELRLLLDEHSQKIAGAANPRGRFVNVNGVMKPHPESLNATAISYRLKYAKPSEWGTAITARLPSGNAKDFDKELTSFLRSWAKSVEPSGMLIEPDSDDL